MKWKLGDLVDRVAGFLSSGDKVYLPPQIQYGPKKRHKIGMTKLVSNKDLMEIRAKINDLDMVLVDVGSARRDQLSDNMQKLKVAARHSGAELYGVDPNWVVVSQFEKQ